MFFALTRVLRLKLILCVRITITANSEISRLYNANLTYSGKQTQKRNAEVQCVLGYLFPVCTEFGRKRGAVGEGRLLTSTQAFFLTLTNVFYSNQVNIPFLSILFPVLLYSCIRSSCSFSLKLMLSIICHKLEVFTQIKISSGAYFLCMRNKLSSFSCTTDSYQFHRIYRFSVTI